MSDTVLTLNRQQLSEFLPNQRAIEAFESLFTSVAETLPTGQDDLEAATGAIAAQTAEALASLAFIADQLSLLLLGAIRSEPVAETSYGPPVDFSNQLDYYIPPVALGSIASQNAEKVSISGGTVSKTTLDACVAKGTWTASGTWTIPGFVCTGDITSDANHAININLGAFNAGSITLGPTSATLGTGSSVGFRNDAGSLGWYAGILNSNGARNWVLYDNANSVSRFSVIPGTGVSVTGTFTTTTGFGCNGASAQTAYASGGAVANTGATNTTPYGFTTAAQANGIVTLINNIRAALVANGIMS